jgi:hypothetical protein
MKYSVGDIVTYYFIVQKDDNNSKVIKAWTDNKKLAKFYLEFHHCPNFRLKKLTDRIENISKITEENYHDEIVLYNALIKGKGGKSKIIVIPATEIEIRFINEECQSFLYTKIDYSYLSNAIPFMKEKYQKAFDNIFLNSIIKKVIEERSDKYNSLIELDQLQVLVESFPDSFGR